MQINAGSERELVDARAGENFRTQTVSLNFLSVSLGAAMTGSLAEFYAADSEGAYFGTVGAVAVGLGVLLAVASPYIRKLMSGVK